MRKVQSVKQFTGNVNYGKDLINRQVKKQAIMNSIVSNTKEFTDKAVGMASKADARTGGHVGSILGSVKSAANDSKLLRGIIPDASEFQQVKRTMNGSTADELEKYSRGKAKDQLRAAYDFTDYGNAESIDILGKNYNLAGMTEGERLEHAIRAAEKGRSYRDSMNQLKKGYLMQDQNPLEKAQTYFSNSDYGRKRKAAAGVAVAGLGIMNRYNNGGTLTRDEYGDRDIVGLPFV